MFQPEQRVCKYKCGYCACVLCEPCAKLHQADAPPPSDWAKLGDGERIIAIAATDSLIFLLSAAGQLYQAPLPAVAPKLSPAKLGPVNGFPPGTVLTKIRCGRTQLLALAADGAVFEVGGNVGQVRMTTT